MATTRLLFSALAIHAATAPAQLSPTAFGGIPRWADSALRAAGLNQRFTLSSELNPVYAFGDLDRDGLVDIAVEVKDSGGLRCGIAIVHRLDRSVHIVGAGLPIGNGKDHLPCRGDWGVQSPWASDRHHAFGPDLLYVEEGGTGSGWLIWDGHAYVWASWDDGGA